MSKQDKKRKELLPASNVLQSLLGDGKSALSDQFLRWKLWRFWPKVVGPTLGKLCEPVNYRFGTLTLWVKSSARLQEMRFLQNNLVEKVNEYVGREWVRQVVFTLDRRGVPTTDQVSEEFKNYLDDGEG